MKRILSLVAGLGLVALMLGVVTGPALAWSAGDYKLTSMCKPDAQTGQFRIRATVLDSDGFGGTYSLAQYGSSAAPFTGDLNATDTFVNVPWTSGGDTWIVTITYKTEGPWSITKAVGDNPLCEQPSPSPSVEPSPSPSVEPSPSPSPSVSPSQPPCTTCGCLGNCPTPTPSPSPSPSVSPSPSPSPAPSTAPSAAPSASPVPSPTPLVTTPPETPPVGTPPVTSTLAASGSSSSPVLPIILVLFWGSLFALVFTRRVRP